MSKIWTRDEVAEKLETDNRWLIRGLLALYERQTADEQQTEQTSHSNGMGFNGTDANILTSFAKQVLVWQAVPAGERKYPMPLSPRQLELARRKLRKYAGQLARLANAAVEQAAQEAAIERAAIQAEAVADGELTATVR